ncbi:MAG: FecR family protein [Deltaproteobacteria bacterium]|nr:FecR family protein [Deltaproteobacteria bacterium]
MKTWVSLVTAMLLLITGLVVAAPAEVVGRLTLVEGRVDLLKGGQLPANAAKLEDPVELGDVLRTKSLSKANITFVDSTVITISPESRIAIEEYMFDPAKGKRNAVLQLFHGMALAVVSKIFKAEQPDFVIKTHTAIMGVRGTEVGVRLSPNDSTFLNFQGLTRVASAFPEISGDLFRKAAKVALSFGQGYVDLGNMQATTVTRGMPPTLPYGISNEDRQMFMRQMIVSTLSPQGGGGASPAVCSPTTGSCTTTSTVSSSSSVEVATASLSSTASGISPSAVVTAIYIPPVIAPPPAPVVAPPPAPAFVSLSFSQMILNLPATISSSPSSPTAIFHLGSVSSTFSATFAAGSAMITLPSSFTLATTTFTANITVNSRPPSFWNNGLHVTFNPYTFATAPTTVTGTLSGLAGGPLSGTVSLTLTLPGAQTFTLEGPVTYAGGILTFTNLSGTFTTMGGLPSGTVSSALWTQVATSATATAAGTQLVSSNLAGTRLGPQRGLLLRR